MDSVKPIAMLAITLVVATQSGCLSHRAGRYAIRHGSAAVKSHAEARRDARAARAAQERVEDREDYRTAPRNAPIYSREDERMDPR